MSMTKKARLNGLSMATAQAGLGTVIENLITNVNAMRAALLNGIFFVPGLAIGASAKGKVLITNAVHFVLAGTLYQIAAQEVAFTSTTHDIAPNAESVQEACYKLSVAANGTVSITKGTTATGAGSATIPATPANQVSLGYVRVAVDAGATLFNATTDNLDAAHLTVTYVDEPHAFSAIAAIPSINVV